MTFLAIVYPDISQRDFDWIQNIRKEHDPHYFNVVKPHVTLIFGTNKLSLNAFTKHIKSKLATTSSFEITFDSVRLVEDDSRSFFHVFLVPSKGFDEINKMHDLLYRDDLESELRMDIPFVPHLGIGTGDKLQMTQLVNNLKNQNLSIEGRIHKVSIVEYDGSEVKDLSACALLR